MIGVKTCFPKFVKSQVLVSVNVIDICNFTIWDGGPRGT